jgi:hypothetical protein
MPKATSTGTTIVGCLFKDGIVLGADTRATSGPIVADKNCEKVQIQCLGPSHLVALLMNSPIYRFIISANPSDAVALAQRRTLSSSPPSFRATLSYMRSQLVASPVLSPP